MHRLAPVLLIGAALLLATSLRAPASPTVPVSAPAAAPFVDVQASAVLTEVNAQVEKLRARLVTTPDAPTPSRDPFRFGDREPRRPDAVTVEMPEAPEVIEPPVVLPRLVAIVAETVDGTITRRAFVAYDDAVRAVTTGDRIGPFTIGAIGATGVELVDAARASTHVIRIQ